MCRLAYIKIKNNDPKLLEELFTNLEIEAGGDGNGIGGFVNGLPVLAKAVGIPVKEFVVEADKYKWDNGFFFHTRRASVGNINDVNCHPFIWGNTITVHNGHIDGFGVLKLMMLENLEKYADDGWTKEKIISTTDSDILAYFIWKRGFETVLMMASGTVMTAYSDLIKVFVGYCLEAIDVKGTQIYASSFSDEMGMMSDRWVVFEKGTELTIAPDGNCTFISGSCYDGKVAWALRQKNRKNKRSKYIKLDVI